MGGTNWSTLITYEQCAEKIMKYHKSQKLISVGSGYGVLEEHIQKTYAKTNQKLELICIDPEPCSYRFQNYPQQPLIKPDYAYIDDYLEQLEKQQTKEQLYSCEKNYDSDLLLCWSSPNDSTYDLEAIIKLKPTNVFIIYEMTGSAGSSSLHNWIYNKCSNIPKVKVPLWLNHENATIFKEEGYKCIDSIVREHCEQFQYAFLVLSRE
jgi:hypothetical protein